MNVSGYTPLYFFLSSKILLFNAGGTSIFGHGIDSLNTKKLQLDKWIVGETLIASLSLCQMSVQSFFS